MNSKGLISRAAEMLSKGEYQTALRLYKEAEEVFGKGLFDYNIKLCQDNVGNSLESRESILNDYFDHIYVVNMENQAANRIKVLNQLQKSKIGYELFSATNGYEGEPLKKWNWYKDQPLGNLKRYPQLNEREISRGKKFIESAGAVGYIYTYLRILKDAKTRGFGRILILEDDIILANNFEEKVQHFLSLLPEDWKVLQFGASQYGWESFELDTAAHDGFYKPRMLETTGSFAIAFDMSIADELIEAEEAFESPFDLLPMGEMYEKYLGKCFVAYPNIVMPDVADSSIRGGRCQYEHSKKVKWNVDNFTYPYPKPSLALVVSNKSNLKYLPNFSKPENASVDLRLYKTSSDGLRPIHHEYQIEDGYKLDKDLLETSPINRADFYAVVEPHVIVTEDLLVKFIEAQLEIVKAPPSGIISFSANATETVKGKVSVVVPTYKRPTNLQTAITSILEQDYYDYEILIINDNGEGSPYNEETDAVIESLKLRDPMGRIRYIKHKENRNGAAARNTGILRARGEFISFLDDDDMYLPNRLSDCVERLEGSNNRYGAAYCGFLGWNSPQNNEARYKEGDLTKELLLLDYMKHYLHTNTATYKNDAVFSLNGFDESYRRHQDLEFNLRFFELYETLATKTSGVRLNPAPSDISNKVFNESMLELKDKFLSQFHNTIKKLDCSEDVYKKHWGEVARYINDKEKLEIYLRGKLENGPLQISLDMEI
jgi:glycosyltransferase involved in cell wall biosynthesis/GR25 family glycosyltransferase involved in LPS biosynthesis